jgi:hypothetical protein
MNECGRNPLNKGPVQIEKLYINNLSVDIIVVENTGFRHLVPRSKGRITNEFVIRTIYTIDYTELYRCSELFHNFRGTCGDDVKIIGMTADNITKGSRHRDNYYQKMIVGIDRQIKMSDLKNADGCIYHISADIVVSTFDFARTQGHPRAMGSVTLLDFNRGLTKDTTGFSLGIGIEMVNRAMGAEPMYTLAIKKVSKIPVTKDPTRKDGFYITTVEPNISAPNLQKLVCTYHEISEASNLGIYRTENEALTNGDIKLLKEQEIAVLRHEVELAKAHATIEKTKLDQSHELFMANYNKRLAELNESAKVSAVEFAEKVRSAKHYADLQEQILKDQASELVRLDRQREIQYEDKMRHIKEESALAARIHDEHLRAYAVANEERERAYKERARASDREIEFLKEHYQEKDFKRKNFSDILKIITVTISTMGVLIVTYNKTFGKESK